MSEELKYWYLRDHKLFRVLSFGQIRELCIITGFRKAKRGDTIELSEVDAPRIFLLKKGAIKIVSLDEDGTETVKDVIRKGDLFGELTLEGTGDGHEYAKVLSEDVIICSFLLSDFENLMRRHPDLAVSYTKFVGMKMKRIRNNYTNLISKDARSRLLHFLEDWAEREGETDSDEIRIPNYLTQNDIAQLICTSRQTAVQLLHDLENEGILRYSRSEIRLYQKSLPQM